MKLTLDRQLSKDARAMMIPTLMLHMRSARKDTSTIEPRPSRRKLTCRRQFTATNQKEHGAWARS